MPVIQLVAARFPFTRTTQVDHGEEGGPAERGKDAVKGGSDNYTQRAPAASGDYRRIAHGSRGNARPPVTNEHEGVVLLLSIDAAGVRSLHPPIWSSDRFEARTDPAAIDPSSFCQPRPQVPKHVAFGLTSLAGAG
jgi:hypothetical protein